MLAIEGQLGEFLIGTSNQSEILRENVGIQFLSLRQRVLVQNSLSPFKRANIPINTGLRPLTSGLRGRSGGPKFSLSGHFSPNLRTT
jgi:hypothetical protein